MRTTLQSALFVLFTLCATLSHGQSPIPLERKVAQMIILGMVGTEVSDSSQIISTIRDKGIGGVILFEHNITPVDSGLDSKQRLQTLCSNLQAASPEKLIISIDQEGGRVNRLKTKYGFVSSVTAQHLGEVNQQDSSRHYYGRMAEQLKGLGINVNFGPTVDLNINPECPAIGIYGRSYSASKSKVNRHARFFIEEHHRNGVKTALKHFPGHGSSVKDSHLGFTDVTRTWRKKELQPYRHFIKRSLCDMVMVSHVFNSTIDPDYPATLSRLTIDGLLRKALGYNGVVVTDDMNMKAITANYSWSEALALSINAGVDLIIISNNLSRTDNRSFDQTIHTIVTLVKEGTIPVQRIDESYDRILRFKAGLN